ncbi:helix-turn-helix domain-containing protein [Loigolactobacillus binensis]|uniref:Helix-turn-helix domain-containing protein n=1 Tax=Loigolactobacillus binensis TaxID=2559922 RepID=A0ABW3E8N0_9LACO|nr:helix-turn-helix domain-containing protein [Loigolactobacillus binensis]
MNYTETIYAAQHGDPSAMTQLIKEFQPLIISITCRGHSNFDEDRYQILTEQFIRTVYKFNLERYL